MCSCSQVPVATSTEFVQGKTWRWGVAWSFDSDLKTKVSYTKKTLISIAMDTSNFLLHTYFTITTLNHYQNFLLPVSPLTELRIIGSAVCVATNLTI